jgi:peptidoglycan/xylan/chitin deacetylase (PgdA/CDA1 family)
MAASIPILTFHTLDDLGAVISVSPGVFRRGMARLHGGGYRTVSLLDALDCLRDGPPFSDRSFVMTFDDGYQTVYDEAFPILQRYGMTATVFLTVGQKAPSNPRDRLPSLHGRPMLTWHEIQDMHRWGVSFGAHTLTHPDLTRLPGDQIESEIRDSKAIIENALGAHVSCFAYPYGRYDRRSREIARMHFACACSDRLGLVTAGSDPYALERVDAYYLRKDRLFDLMFSEFFPWYIRMRSIPRRVRRRAVHFVSG